MSVPDGLLVLLSEAPKHGYQLATELAVRTAGQWTLNTGQVYTTLDRLARDGFVEPVEAPMREGDAAERTAAEGRRRLWRTTDLGSERAVKWLDSAPAQTHERDELVLRVLLVAAVDPVAAIDVVEQQRRDLVGRLQVLRRDQRDAAAEPLAARMATDAAAIRLEAQVAWLDRCEQRLRDTGTSRSDPADTEEQR